MTTREKFKRRVIELIHGVPYDEAIKKEKELEDCIYECYEIDFGYSNKPDFKRKFYIARNFKKHSTSDESDGLYYCDKSPLGLPITLPRVMQALINRHQDCFKKNIESKATVAYSNFDYWHHITTEIWKLTKENGQECTDDDNTDETIEALYNLIK